MEENPYEPPTTQVDASDSPLFRWLDAILQVVVAVFLALMAVASVIGLLLGTFALGYRNDFFGGMLVLGSIVTGILTLAAVVQIARRRT